MAWSRSSVTSGRATKTETLLECPIDLREPLVRNRPDPVPDPFVDRDGADLTAEGDGILPERTLLGRQEDLEGIQLGPDRVDS